MGAFGYSRPMKGALFVALVSVGLSPGAAFAEAGDHLKVGSAEVVPSLKLGYEWRSNLYLEENPLFPASGEEGTVRGSAFVATPGLSLSLLTNEVSLELGASYGVRKFFASSNSQDSNYNVANLDQFNNFDVAGNLHILPNGLVGLRLEESMAVSNRPIESQFADDALITRTRNDTGGYIVLSPGNALSFDLGGFFLYDQYDGNEGSSELVSGSRVNNKLGYGGALRSQWEFFPRTALVLDGQVEKFDWERNVVTTAGDEQLNENTGNGLAMPDGWGWRASAGIKGRVTNKVVVNAVLGYGQTTYDEQSVLDYADAISSNVWGDELDPSEGWGKDLKGIAGLLAYGSVTWTPVNGQSFSAGYKRDFQDSWFTNYVTYNSGFARYNGALARRWDLRLEGNYRLEAYNGEVVRNDHVLSTTAGLSYDATYWLSLDGGSTWRRRVSADSPALASIEYDDIGFQLGLKLTY